MKQFNLYQKTKTDDGIYQIWFGNRNCIEFKQKRQAAAFLAETNRFLTVTLIECNEFLKQVYIEFRNSWFIMQHFKNGRVCNMTEEENRIKNSLHAVEEMFERAGNTFSGAGDNGWSFIYLKKICYFLNDAIAELIEVNKKRNNTMAFHNLVIIKNRLLVLVEKIEHYPPALPAGAIALKSNK